MELRYYNSAEVQILNTPTIPSYRVGYEKGYEQGIQEKKRLDTAMQEIENALSGLVRLRPPSEAPPSEQTPQTGRHSLVSMRPPLEQAPQQIYNYIKQKVDEAMNALDIGDIDAARLALQQAIAAFEG